MDPGCFGTTVFVWMARPTDPSLIAKNPQVRELVAAGHKLTENKRTKNTGESFSRFFL
jgi:hypothetical protein